MSAGSLTPASVEQLCPLNEAEVARPGPRGLGVSKTGLGVKVICLQALLPIDGVVATGTVGAVHPDLTGREGGRVGKYTDGLVTQSEIDHGFVSLLIQFHLTSPRWESPRGPLVSGFTMITLTPGKI